MLACALDRLTLLAAGSEPKIGALFAQAELKRTFCGANNVFFAATPQAQRLDRGRARSAPARPEMNSAVIYCLLNGFCQPRRSSGARGG